MSKPEHPWDEEIAGLESVLRSLATEARAQAGPHVPPERLMAYHSQELPDNEVTAIQNHLVACRECPSVLLEFVAFNSLDDESSQASPAEIATGWAELQARLNSVSNAPQSPQESRSSLAQRLVEWINPHRVVYALAGLLLAVTLSFAIWVKRENRDLIARLNQLQDPVRQGSQDAPKFPLEREVQDARRQRDEERSRAEQLEARAAQLEAQVAEERRRNSESKLEDDQPTTPRTIGPVLSLSLSTVRGGGQEPRELKVPADASIFTLQVRSPVTELDYFEYALEIEDLNGTTIFSKDKLHPQPSGGLKIVLQQRSLPEGQYRFKVFGIKRGGRTPIGDWLVQLTYN